MSFKNWEHFFKPEIRSSGHKIYVQEKVSVTQPSDTEVVAFIRISPPLKVTLKSNSISSPTLFVDCNCTAGKKDAFCKHIWASLLATYIKNPDFFESKIDIEKTTSTSNLSADNKTDKKAELKEKQNLYRKIQYQKQKLRINQLKQNKKNIVEVATFPTDVEKALVYFSNNGFEFREELTKELVGSAKKKLSRIFHPDRNGSHDEIVELNKNADILIGFAKK